MKRKDLAVDDLAGLSHEEISEMLDEAEKEIQASGDAVPEESDEMALELKGPIIEIAEILDVQTTRV